MLGRDMHVTVFGSRRVRYAAGEVLSPRAGAAPRQARRFTLLKVTNRRCNTDHRGRSYRASCNIRNRSRAPSRHPSRRDRQSRSP